MSFNITKAIAAGLTGISFILSGAFFAPVSATQELTCNGRMNNGWDWQVQCLPLLLASVISSYTKFYSQLMLSEEMFGSVMLLSVLLSTLLLMLCLRPSVLQSLPQVPD